MGDFASQFIGAFHAGRQAKLQQEQHTREQELHDLRIKAMKAQMDQAKLEKDLHLRQLNLQDLLTQPIGQGTSAPSPGGGSGVEQFQPQPDQQRTMPDAVRQMVEARINPQSAGQEGPAMPPDMAAQLRQAIQAPVQLAALKRNTGQLTQENQQLAPNAATLGYAPTTIPGIEEAGIPARTTTAAAEQENAMRKAILAARVKAQETEHILPAGSTLVSGAGKTLATGGPALPTGEFEKDFLPFYAQALGKKSVADLTPTERLMALPKYKEMNTDPVMRATLLSLRNMQIQLAQANVNRKDAAETALDNVATSIANGNLSRIRDITSMRNDQRTILMDKILQINPKFNTAELDRKIKMEDYIANGKGADQLQSFGTFLEHAGEAADAIKSVPLTDARLLNKPLNWLRQNAASSPEVARLLAAVEPVKKEFEKFLLNNQALYSEDRISADKILDVNAAPAAFLAAVQQMGKVAKDRVNEINYRYKRVMSKDLELPFSPEAIQGAQKIGAPLTIGGAAPTGGGVRITNIERIP